MGRLFLLAALVATAAPFRLAPTSRVRGSRVARFGAPPEIVDAATKQIEAFKISHGGHTPAELTALEKSIKAGEAPEIGAKMYELLCTSMLDYDRDEADSDKLVVSATKGEARRGVAEVSAPAPRRKPPSAAGGGGGRVGVRAARRRALRSPARRAARRCSQRTRPASPRS